MTREAVDERVGIVREAAGERLDDIELNIRAFFVSVTDDRAGTLANVAGFIGVEEAMVAASPFALIGSADTIVDELVRRREELGFSYVIVGGGDIDAFAPVVAAPRRHADGPATSSLQSLAMTAMPSPLTVKRSSSSPRSSPTRYHVGHLHVLVDDAAVQARPGPTRTPWNRIESVTWASWSTNTPGATIDRSTWAPEMIEPSHSSEPSTWAGSPPGPRDTFAGGSGPRYVYTGHRSL